MNYPSGTIVQNYNVAAGRVIQLPCFMDQQEPPDGFRAIVFATPSIVTPTPLNQTGPNFVGGGPCAIQFDLTQLIQQNALSRARSIFVSVNFPVFDPNSCSIRLLLDSGLSIPFGPNNGPQFWTSPTLTTVLAPDACLSTDFISANPIFALFCSSGTNLQPQFTVAVTNFKLDALASTNGLLLGA